MNINPIIESAFAGLTYNNKPVPIYPIVYPLDDKPAAYITYATILEKDGEYADDEPIETDITATVDVFCSGNYKSLLADIKARLKLAGFTITGIGPEQYEPNTGLYHVTIDVYMEDFADG